MEFPSHNLVPEGGEIYAHIFENPDIGIARKLFWSITVNFKQIKHGEKSCKCSMICEWIPWQIPDWRDLDGQRLDVEYAEDGIESSFYFVEHHIGSRTKLRLTYRKSNIFNVSLDMIIDFQGNYGGDENPAMPISATVDVPFTGLLVVSDNLEPKPTTLDEARHIASQFVKLSRYEEPKREGHAYVFKPMIANKL